MCFCYHTLHRSTVYALRIDVSNTQLMVYYGQLLTRFAIN